MSVWGTLFYPRKMFPRPPRTCIVEPRAPKRLPQWTPKVKLVGTSGKSIFAAIYDVFSTFEGPRMTHKSVLLWKASRSLFFEAPGLKKGTKGSFEAIWGTFWISLWCNVLLNLAVLGGEGV